MMQPTQVPVFIEANSKTELVQSMLQNNLSRGAHFPYQIVKDGKKWTAWYYLDVKDQIFNKVTNGK